MSQNGIGSLGGDVATQTCETLRTQCSLEKSAAEAKEGHGSTFMHAIGVPVIHR